MVCEANLRLAESAGFLMVDRPWERPPEDVFLGLRDRLESLGLQPEVFCQYGFRCMSWEALAPVPMLLAEMGDI